MNATDKSHLKKRLLQKYDSYQEIADKLKSKVSNQEQWDILKEKFNQINNGVAKIDLTSHPTPHYSMENYITFDREALKKIAERAQAETVKVVQIQKRLREVYEKYLDTIHFQKDIIAEKLLKEFEQTLENIVGKE